MIKISNIDLKMALKVQGVKMLQNCIFLKMCCNLILYILPQKWGLWDSTLEIIKLPFRRLVFILRWGNR